MAEKPGGGHRWPAYHRYFWRHVVPWEMRFWLAFAAILVIGAAALLVVVLVDATS